jgi:hypothetical protein
MTHLIVEQKKNWQDDEHNHSNNFNGSNMYDLWVLKWLCTKACESEFEYP